MAEKKTDLSVISFLLGLLSIVFAIFTPLAGLVLGIIGFNMAKKQKDDLSLRGKKYSRIGMILSIVILIVSAIVTVYFTKGGLGGLQTFPGN